MFVSSKVGGEKVWGGEITADAARKETRIFGRALVGGSTISDGDLFHSKLSIKKVNVRTGAISSGRKVRGGKKSSRGKIRVGGEKGIECGCFGKGCWRCFVEGQGFAGVRDSPS